MSSVRTIKKYPNRRLYDTEVSRYITLSDVRELVMEGQQFKVMDTSNEEDITRSILLQIMLEEETGGEPLFTADMLAQIICFYGGTFQGVFARYLEQSLDLFAKQQQQLRRAWTEDPLQAMTNMARSNVEMWANLQQDFLRAAGLGSNSMRGEPDEKAKG
ncbi:MAG: polyhydroxyalkanoate synthesis repressor PhaR [Chromatiaceae bacterium]